MSILSVCKWFFLPYQAKREVKHTYEKQLCESERGRWELWKVCSRAACTVHYSFTSSDIYWYKSLSLFIWKPLQFNVLCIFKQCLVFVENIYNLKQCYLTVAVLPYTKTIFHREPTICFCSFLYTVLGETGPYIWYPYFM